MKGWWDWGTGQCLNKSRTCKWGMLFLSLSMTKGSRYLNSLRHLCVDSHLSLVVVGKLFPIAAWTEAPEELDIWSWSVNWADVGGAGQWSCRPPHWEWLNAKFWGWVCMNRWVKLKADDRGEGEDAAVAAAGLRSFSSISLRTTCKPVESNNSCRCSADPICTLQPNSVWRHHRSCLLTKPPVSQVKQFPRTMHALFTTFAPS